MKKHILFATTATLIASTAAFAQSTSTSPPRMAPSTAERMPDATTPKLTAAEALALVHKAVYSIDNKNLGEVASVRVDDSGKVTELQADVGGFLGIGETRVRINPTDFKISGDHVVLNLTSEQVRALPKIVK